MAGEMRPAGIDDPNGPRKRAKENRERADEHSRSSSESASAHEEADTSETQNDSGEERCVGSPLFCGGGKKQEDQDGFASDEKRSKTGGYFQFRPVQGTVATEEKESADENAGADLRPGGAKPFSKAPE